MNWRKGCQLLPPILSLENILLKAANREDYDIDYKLAKTSCYKDDINFDRLCEQLPLLADLVQVLPTVISIHSM